LSGPKIAIIGCGAFTEMYYLPAFAKQPAALENLILVDTNPARLKELADRFHVTHTASDYHEVLGNVDGAIIVTPHYLHHPIALDFIRQGTHVLCEKPLTESPDEAQELVAEADKHSVALATNYTQRLFPSSGKIKQLIAEQTLGRTLSIRYAWGSVYTWPTASGFYFDSKKFSKGVLMDRGPHPIDLISWWLGGKPTLVSCETDSFGGPEAFARARMEYAGCQVEIVLSWLTYLSNTYTITGELGTINNGTEDWWHVPIAYTSGKREIISLESDEEDYSEFGIRLVANFIDVITSGVQPLIPGREVLPSVELIEDCYANAKRFDMPWLDNVEEFVYER
jgi:UDP-N-acetylglucosamine 3-dehydrogenase